MTKKERSLLSNRFYSAKNRAEKTSRPFAWESFDDWLVDFHAYLEEHAIDFDIDTYRVAYDMRHGGYSAKGLRVDPVKRGPSKVEFSRLKQQLEKERALRIAAQLELAIQDEDAPDSLEEIVDTLMSVE